MPEQKVDEQLAQQVSAETAQAAQDAIAQTKRVLSSMVERIFETQKKLGIWEADDDEPETEDMVAFLIDVHAKTSSAYHAFTSGGVIADGDESIELPHILIEMAVDLLGAARRHGVDVGSLFVDTVVASAQMANEPDKEDDLAGLDIEPVQPPAPKK